MTATFESQFAAKEHIDTPFGTVETVDITPEKIVHPMPVLMASGWGETLELQQECLKEIYLSGRRVIALRHAALIKKHGNKTPFPIAELQKAETLLLLLRQKRIQQVDVISHSEGAINAVIAATLQPQTFRNFVLVTPAGVSGRDSSIRIITGFLRHVLQAWMQSPQDSKRMLQGVKRPAHQQEASLLRRLLSLRYEITAMATYDIYPLLAELRKQGSKIAILAGERDTAFPLARMKQHLHRSALAYGQTGQRIGESYGLDLFATKPGGHELYTNTHEIMGQVLMLLDRLETTN